MKIKIENQELELHYSIRMSLIYEQIQNKSIDFVNLKLEDIVILFFTAVVSTLQYNKIANTMKYEDFLNWLDDNGCEKILIEFTNWYVEQVQRQYDLMPESKNKSTEKPDPNV